MRLLILLFLMFFALPTSSQSLDSVLNRYYSSLGGWSNLSEINSCRIESIAWFDLDIFTNRTTINLLDPAEATKTVAVRKSPIFEFAQIFSLQGKLESVFYANGKQNGNIIYGAEFPHGLFVESIFSDRYISVHLAIDLNEARKTNKLEYLGLREFEHHSYYVIKGPFLITVRESYNCLYYFDIDSGLLAIYHNEERPREIVSLSEYRKVDML